MWYIIKISSDGDFGALEFKKSGMTIKEAFQRLKKNSFNAVHCYDSPLKKNHELFYITVHYRSEDPISEDLIHHIKSEWMDYDGLKDTEYFVWEDKEAKE